MKWPETIIETRNGKSPAIAPQIISASRSTDIPAFYSKWFMNRFREGYVKWINPFNRRSQYISFERAKVIVFWSKNPKPLVPYLSELDQKQISYYFHFTLNDYEAENLEPCVPSLNERIDTFASLSNRIGKEKVIWRFDPIILLSNLDVEGILEKIKKVGDEISQFTTKLVFSFADIEVYKKVKNNLKKHKIEYKDISEEIMLGIAKGIANLCSEWGVSASTCAERVDLSYLGIHHNKCIDNELILKITNSDPSMRKLFGSDKAIQDELFEDKNINNGIFNIYKDPGQRKECGCVISKDIGQYNTCSHHCIYCYANTSENAVKRNTGKTNELSESISGDDYLNFR